MTKPALAITIAGRDIALQAPNDGQLAAAMKILSNARRDMAAEERKPEEDRNYDPAIIATGKLLRIIDMLIANEEDRDFLEDKMIAGEVGLLELIVVFEVFNVDKAEKAPTTGPKTRARRVK